MEHAGEKETNKGHQANQKRTGHIRLLEVQNGEKNSSRMENERQRGSILELKDAILNPDDIAFIDFVTLADERRIANVYFFDALPKPTISDEEVQLVYAFAKLNLKVGRS